MKDYKTPILTSVFNIIGALVLIVAFLWLTFGVVVSGQSGSAAGLLPAVGVALALVLTALTYFGVAQAFDYLGRTAHSANKLCTLIETSVVRHIQSLEARISSSTPIRVCLDQPEDDKARYHYSVEGTHEGPFTADELRHFRDSGIITFSTQVFRDGDSQWRTFEDYPELALS